MEKNPTRSTGLTSREFTPKEGLRGMLYASGAVLAGLLLGETLKGGLKKMNLGSIMARGTCRLLL